MKRALLVALAVAVALVLLGAVGVWSTVRASLPELEGERALAGLSAPVTVERDADGVTTITGETRADVARALGFVHAQERFFQMDLLRRSAAGEIAALVGAAAWPADSSIRVHRFRARAADAVGRLPAEHRAVLAAYAEGANAGLGALSARPFEYLALRAEPEPWRPEDTILCAFAMTIDLQHERDGGVELARQAIVETVPDALAAFLLPRGDAWDAPLTGGPIDPPPVPTADEVGDFMTTRTDVALPEAPVRGSNNWAVAGGLSETGSAIVADDMHLGLRLPHVWFRAALVFGPEGDRRRVDGATLPGTPLVVVGSNGDVAWGFTNAYGDFVDHVALEESRPGVIETAGGPAAVDTVYERVAVGDEVRTLAVVETPFGPVVTRDAEGTAYAMQWTAHRPGGVDLNLLGMETARTLDEALAVGNRSGIPAQNLVAGDRAGRIGWTIAGRVPARRGHDGRRPIPSTDPDALWTGFVAPDDVPRITDPEGGRLWTANSRVVDGEALAVLGWGDYAHGARARQIRDGLRALDAPVDERDLLAIALDDRALFYARWRDLLLATLDGAPETPDRAALRETVRDWSGRAAPDDAGYRLVREWRSAVVDDALGPLLAPARARRPSFDYPARDETAVWRLVTERPAHLLSPRFDSWDELLVTAADTVVGGYDDPAAATWGERNRLAMRHPLAGVLPSAFADQLAMPAVAQPGDSRMPRVSDVDFGASQRMVVSPGHEDRGIFHMPGGQAGHPLSPYWGAGHDDWVEGRPSPFLPGETRWTLRLTPDAGG